MFNKIGYHLKKSSPYILMAMGVAGFGISVWKTAKQTYKHHATMTLLIDNLDHIKEDKDDAVVAAKTVAKIYAEPIAWAAAATVCIISAGCIAHKQQASLIGAYELLRHAYNRESSKLDSGERYKILQPPRTDEDEQLMYDEYSTQYFRSSLADLLNAEYRINEILHQQGYISVGDAQSIMKIPQCGCGDNIGWSLNAGDWNGYNWISFENNFCRLDDGLECWIVTLQTMPTPDYMEY